MKALRFYLNDPGTGNEKDVEKHAYKNLTRLYIIALSAVALLTISGQFLIHNTLNNQLNDSHVINLTGSQRYKIQQICKLVLLLDSDTAHKNYPDKLNALKVTFDDWRRTHRGLKKGDAQLHLPGKNSKKILEMFEDLDPYFNAIHKNVLQILQIKKTSGADIKEQVNTILDNEDVFLSKMDAIVHEYDGEAKEKVLLLKNIEFVLLIVTLLILLLEGFFIFRPAVLKIKGTIHELVLSENLASGLAKDLSSSNNALEKSLKELRDIYFALEHATILAKTDKYGIINYVNDRFCEISKYAKDELVGNRFHLLSGHYHSKSFFDNMWETISNGKIWNNEIKNRAKDGSYFWMDATIVPVLDNSGTPMEYFAIYTDVTQRFKQSINEQKIRTTSIIEGQEKERKKIARELHDGLGQMLTALKFSMEGLKVLPDAEQKEKFEEIKKLMAETIGEVRKISFNLMPTVLNDFGIGPAFKHLAEQLKRSSNTNIIFENKIDFERLPKTVEINLYRILQEALNNAIKYSGADQVMIRLKNNKEYLLLEIEDDGKGFTVKKNSKSKSDLSGNGIANIQERTSLIDGEFRIETAPGMGTKIKIRVPLKNILTKTQA